ncbi:NOP15 [Candida pseudojiufengensis]|uniref:NOP15 n=1 Tax=Candida pseudojiufengensis TaxID=497109 RepID=UPI0022259F2A|nr:NOP15 [Candida pseudojiufengensis]KAI5959881.1 NOP15 [Candida pseudojiufengensis]
MAKKQTSKSSKVQTKPAQVEAEGDIQLPSSSESSESENEEIDEEVYGLSSDEEDVEEPPHMESSDEEEIELPPSTTAAGHKVNKVIKPKDSTTTKTKNSSSKSGVIYIGRLPSGFQESELKTYFKQFGDIKNLKLSRNKKTGKSKHYAYIEFESSEVAKIAVDTMNNYLLNGHLIRCEYVENPHKDVFKNSNKKFKIIPVHKIAKAKHDNKKTKEEWEKLTQKFEESKQKKIEELKSKGIDFNLAELLA